MLALRRACAREGVPLQLDLGGGEALISRARAAMLAKFLASEATHLLFVPSDRALDADAVLQAMAGSASVTALGDESLLIARAAAEQVVGAHAELGAGLEDVRGPGAKRAAMVFETRLQTGAGAYLADLAAFAGRWRELGGGAETSAPAAPSPRSPA